MTIPDFQSCFEPLLKMCEDGKEHHLQEAISFVAKKFALSQQESGELLPSGKQAIVANRVGWARTYLVKAGLIDATRRAYFRITERGTAVLKNPPEKLNVRFLKQYPEFLSFHQNSNSDEKSIVEVEEDIDQEEMATPMERLESAYLGIRKDLAQTLLQRVKKVSPEFFERLVVQLLVAMGYGGTIRDAGKALGKTGDGGIDGIIKEDRLGLDAIYVQAKRWEGCVGRPEIQKFAGALSEQRARKGVFITTGHFSEEAKNSVTRLDAKLVLIDGELLAQYMIDFSVGVSSQQTFDVKRIDEDFFEQE